MNCSNCETCPMALGLRWAGRILSVVMFALVALFFFGAGDIPLFQFNTREFALIAPFLLATIGLLVAWRREAVGAAMIVGGMVLFYGVHRMSAGSFPKGWFFGLIALPGLLFLAATFFESCRRRHLQTPRSILS